MKNFLKNVVNMKDFFKNVVDPWKKFAEKIWKNIAKKKYRSNQNRTDLCGFFS